MAEDTPLDRFKLALTGAARAMAGEAEIEINWTADNPGQSGGHFRVPVPGRVNAPGREVPRDAAMVARGHADSYALKLRHHNAALHARALPSEPVARACYDAVEQVRYEALGAQGYEGVRVNLGAALDQRIASDPITRAPRAEDVPMQTALQLLLREHLLRQPIPEPAREGVEMVREWIEARTGGDFSALAESLTDQKAFQALSLDMLRHLDLTQPEQTSDPGEDEDEDEGEQDTEEQQDEEQAGQEQQPVEMAADRSQGDEQGESDTQTELSDDETTEDAGEDSDEGMLPVRPNRPWTDLPADFEYQVFTEQFDEIVAAQD
ncbi:MAG TPA: cobaltochelatase subunit CobT, partial [Novosphingobium sp.]|nr:cobaltochelatase subunit CobT [Novosphingobium sp.]